MRHCGALISGLHLQQNLRAVVDEVEERFLDFQIA
jgi:hypothetical protein